MPERQIVQNVGGSTHQAGVIVFIVSQSDFLIFKNRTMTKQSNVDVQRPRDIQDGGDLQVTKCVIAKIVATSDVYLICNW